MAVAAPAAAQTRQARASWPAEAVNLVVPFPEGGGSAILAKLMAQAFERQTRQALRLQYLGGAGGVHGASYVAKAEPNGQHLFIGGSYLTMTHALTQDDGFDIFEDLYPLAMVARVPQVVLVNPARMRTRTVTEWLIDLSRRSRQYRMATAGLGSASHITAEVLRHQEALRFEFVHFRGSGPALQDLLSGAADMMIDGLISSLPHIRSGRLKALMVTGSERSPVLPDVPCSEEVGVRSLDAVTWYGLFAPRQLPAAKAQEMEQVFRRIGEDALLRGQFEALGIHWADLYGEAFAAAVRQDAIQWTLRLQQMGMPNLLQKDASDV